MASTYSNLGIELVGSGEQTGTWGITTNTNLGTLIDQAIGGYTTTACTGGTDTITIPNGATGVARNMFLELTGTGGGTLVVPTNKKLYFVYNNTASAITVKVTGLTGVSVPAAAKMVLVCNGTDVVVAQNYLASLTLGAALPVASGGTGSTSTTAYAVYVGNSAGTGFTPIAPNTSGNLLTSNGTNWASTALTSLTNIILSNPTITAYLETAPSIVNSSTAQTLSLASGTVLSYTLTGNCVFTMPTATSGTSFIVKLIQDGTGGRTATFTGVKYPSGLTPTITTTATTGTDIISFVCINSVWYGNASQAFA